MTPVPEDHGLRGDPAAAMMASVSDRPGGTDRGPWARLFWLLFALAGLGVGIWLFGRRRRSGSEGWDAGANGSLGD